MLMKVQVESFWIIWVRQKRLTVYFLYFCIWKGPSCVFVQLTVIVVVDESVGGELLDQLGGAG